MSNPATRTTTHVAVAGDDALTLDMLGQFVFCPRRFHLMYVEGRWADNAFTVDGLNQHRRVDERDHLLPAVDDGDEPPATSRSVPLSSQTLGITGKLDLVQTDGDEAVPVETKRRRVPDCPGRAYDTVRVQLMAQGLLLREHGYTCHRGVIYYAGSRTRVDVPFDDALERLTLEVIRRTRQAAAREQIPEPLEDSPKCNGCSLNAICLPDETLALRDVPRLRESAEVTGLTIAGKPVRRMVPTRADGMPLYVQEQGSFVGKTKGRLTVKLKGEQLAEARLADVSQLVLMGNVMVSAATVQLLCEAEVPIVHLSRGGWFYGVTNGVGLKNAYDRVAQYRAAGDPRRRVEFARQLVLDKVQNQRTLLRRNGERGRDHTLALRDLDDLLPKIERCTDEPQLLGLEGAAAAAYFRRFGSMLRPADFDADSFDFAQRNRRPPRDPVNALLSFTYAMLAKECTTALIAEGLDAYWGLYHKPRHGRPALALDLMEPLRPLVADSAVLTAINTGMVKGRHFEVAAGACALRPAGKKGIIGAYEARLDQLVTHPLFDYRCSWRTVLRLQARLLARWLRGDVPRFQNIVTR
jgi:CRISPR-associated endonuclease Cas1/CRISPR-associated protein Cas4